MRVRKVGLLSSSIDIYIYKLGVRVRKVGLLSSSIDIYKISWECE